VREMAGIVMDATRSDVHKAAEAFVAYGVVLSWVEGRVPERFMP
jgi:hypothetical protein